MLTLFFVPKAFEGNFAIIQENAIKSWTTVIDPRPQIILLGNEKRAKDICTKYNLVHIPHIKKNNFSTPLLSDIFEKAQNKAVNKIMVYINSDIIVTNNIDSIASKLARKHKQFLASGRRYEIQINKLIHFKSDWRKVLIERCNEKNLKNSAWLDYFIFTKGLFRDIPPFALGRTFWDKWLIWKAVHGHYPVIDVTKHVLAIHQSHGYRSTQSVWEGKEAIENIRLAGGWSHGYSLDEAINKKKPRPTYLLKKIIDRFPATWPLFLKIRKIRNKII
ncbi:hypothetical protein HZC27_05910 [Candidatus Roizmanbacteria bacterium]|nr:hypothetical protein [Candidatus Roizmanbacteria bacterium]